MFRKALFVSVLLLLSAPGASLVAAACGKDGCCGGPGRGGPGADQQVFHALLGDHDKIRREVEDIDNGVRTLTTSEDPQVAGLIRTHVDQMKARMESGRGLRHWDPLFVELFAHHAAIEMKIREVPGGVEVIETSEDPAVVRLIRAHARTVSEFAGEGFARAHRPSPLPEGYEARAEPAKERGCGGMQRRRGRGAASF